MQDIIERLDSFRKKLIDLTSRNSLLNSNLSSTNLLRFVDELPDQVFNYIVEEENSMYLQAVPLPTEEEFWLLNGFDEETLPFLEKTLSEMDPEERKKIEEELEEYLSRTAVVHAKSLNINTAYEAPIVDPADEIIGRHQDNQLQTLHFYEDLDAFAAKIRRLSNESLQEKGMNTLYLTFGYLEWQDVRYENKTHLAPLISVPVSISRESKNEVASRKRSSEGELKTLSRKLYKIQYTGSDIATNEALKLKLESQSTLLSEFESDQNPEDYFSVVNEEIISHNPTWKIHRYINLSKLDFSGSILYQDLDIKNWIDGSLASHPLIGQMFGKRPEIERGDIDYELDALPELDVEAPIVMDADSSQHSAMIDALRGKNMVIVGPPGTGKSQTITNLIAGFLHQEKKVLFVAQKSAALTVVKDRLNEIGLGGFCLDLHSTKKSHKKEIIDDLESRLTENFPNPGNIQHKRNNLNALRKEIGDYCNFVNKIQHVELSSQRILAKVVNLQSKINVPVRQLTDSKKHPDPDYLDECDIKLKAYFNSIEAILETSFTIETHPWNFVNEASLSFNDIEIITLLLEDLLKSSTNAKQILHELTGDNENSSIVSNLKELQEIIKIDDFLGSESQDYHTVSALIHKSNDIVLHSLINSKETLFNKVLKNDSYYENLSTQITQFKSNYEIEPIHAKALISDCENLRIDLEEYCKSLGDYLSNNSIAINIDTKEDFVIVHPLKEILNAMPIEYEHLRDLKLIKNVTKSKRYMEELEKDLIELDKLAEPFTTLFDITSLPNVSELTSIREAFIEKGFFSFLSFKFRLAKNKFKKFSIIGMPEKEVVIKYLGQLLIYAKKLESIEGNSKYTSTLGSTFSSHSTDIKGINEMLKWHKLILNTNKKQPSQLDSFVERIYMIDVSEIDTFNDNNFIQNANKIDDKFNQMLVDTPKLINGLEKNNSASLIAITQKIDEESTIILDQEDQITKSIELVIRLKQEESLSIDILNQIFKNKDWKWEDFINQYKNSHIAINELLEQYNQLAEKISLDTIHDQNEGFIEKLISLSTNAQNNRESLNTWLNFIRSRDSIDTDEDLSKSLKIAEENDLNTKSMVRNIHEFRMYNRLAKRLLSKNNILGKFNEVRHNTAIKSFKDIDEQLIELNARMIAASLAKIPIPYGNNDNMVRKKTERALIEHLISTPRARVSARDLIKRSSNALIAMKPCVMASPTTVAQYFKREPDIFDVVIMDEASQVRPEDSISAIARCSQAVIVGDPKQMPPSFIFRQEMENENVEIGDETDAESAESILDLAKEAFPMERMLRWHYRSQHQDLIAFSNSHFYENKLVFFPSAVDKSPNLGIQYNFVPDANNSNMNTNRKEAEKVVDYVIDHMKNSKEKESIGIVAMNMNQQQLIDDLLEKKIDEEDDNRVAAYIESFANKDTEKLFVKNLENVQGDERDIIVISFTYAPKEGTTKLSQQFAQLYRDGWRRLNVLLTRAKKKMVIFSSFKFQDVTVKEGTAKGVKALRAFLEYVQNGKLPTPYTLTGREADSDFEIAVIDALRDAGYSCIPQVGVSQYRIDVGVEHPDFPGEFIIGIECDGATYHSSKSARDRDRLRESVLLHLGWKIERIWSTSWFNDSSTEIKRIIDKIEAIRKKDERLPYVEIQTEEEEDEITQTEEVDSLDEELAGDTLLNMMDEASVDEPDEIVAEEEEEEEEEEITQTEELAPLEAEYGLNLQDLINMDTDNIENKYDEISSMLTEEKSAKVHEKQITEELINLRPFIESEFPNVFADHRLLTNKVIEALSLAKPTSFEEYRSEIPFELRRKVNKEEENKYLWEIFEIIEQIIE